MKKSVLRLSVLITLLVFNTSNTLADFNENISSTDSSKTWSIEAGPQFQSFSTKSRDNTTDNTTTIKGFLSGLLLEYFHFSDSKSFFYGGSLSYYSGKSTLSFNTFTFSGNTTILKIQVITGFSIFTNEYNNGYIYFGLSDQSISNDINGITPFKLSYGTLSVPIGLKWIFSLNQQFQVGLDATFGLLSLIDREFIEVNNIAFSSTTITSKALWKLQAPMTYWFTPTFGATITPFMESITYEVDKNQTNKVTQTGAQIKAVFRF